MKEIITTNLKKKRLNKVFNKVIIIMMFIKKFILYIIFM